jgi:hypothetical protein
MFSLNSLVNSLFRKIRNLKGRSESPAPRNGVKNKQAGPVPSIDHRSVREYFIIIRKDRFEDAHAIVTTGTSDTPPGLTIILDNFGKSNIIQKESKV